MRVACDWAMELFFPRDVQTLEVAGPPVAAESPAAAPVAEAAAAPVGGRRPSSSPGEAGRAMGAEVIHAS